VTKIQVFVFCVVTSRSEAAGYLSRWSYKNEECIKCTEQNRKGII